MTWFFGGWPVTSNVEEHRHHGGKPVQLRVFSPYAPAAVPCQRGPHWLKGLSHVPKKLTRLQSINAILAHRPWLINKDDIGALTEEGSATFSVSEVLLAICIMSIVHSHAGFVLGMGLCLEPEDVEGEEGSGTSASPPRAKSRKIRPTAIGQGGDGGGAPGTNGDFDDAEIFQRLGYDIEKLIEDDDTREDVFEQWRAIQIKQEKQQLSDLSCTAGMTS